MSEFDLRRAIGAGGANVKLCAALTNAFVVVEVDEDVSKRRDAARSTQIWTIPSAEAADSGATNARTRVSTRETPNSSSTS